MTIRVRFTILATLVGALAACASIVGLDQADSVTNSAGTQNGSTTETFVDGGTVTGTGLVTLDGGVTVSPLMIDMSNVKCGETKTAPITFVNPGSAPVPFQISIPSSDSFVLEGAGDAGLVQGTIPATSSQVVNLVGQGNAPGNDAVDVVVTVGDLVQQITATIERQGGSLMINPSALNFGDVRSSVGGPSTAVAFKNDGNEPITITSFTGVTADFTAPANILIGAGQQVTQNFAMPPGNSGDPISVIATPQLDGVNCGPIPTLALQGHRTNNSITVTPASIAFNKINCNTTPNTPQNITVTNYSNNVVNYTVTLQSNSKFKVGSPSGTVAATPNDATPTTSVIAIQPLAVGSTPGDVTETVQVTTTTTPATTTATENVKVSMTVYGAAFTINPTYSNQYFPLNDIQYGRTSRGRITNTGNAPVCVTYALSGGDASHFVVEADDIFVANGANDLEVAFGSVNCNTSYTSTVVTTPVDCNAEGLGTSPLPPICTPPPTVQVKGSIRCSGP